jgi:hypothetical protein
MRQLEQMGCLQHNARNGFIPFRATQESRIAHEIITQQDAPFLTLSPFLAFRPYFFILVSVSSVARQRQDAPFFTLSPFLAFRPYFFIPVSVSSVARQQQGKTFPVATNTRTKT